MLHGEERMRISPATSPRISKRTRTRSDAPQKNKTRAIAHTLAGDSEFAKGMWLKRKGLAEPGINAVLSSST